MGSSLTHSALERLKEVMALLLWEMGAIRINLDQPFRLVSGNYSPIYVNCRQAISDPSFMQVYVACANLLCDQQRIEMDVIAGGETAGIAFAAYLAQSRALPMVYVRKATKSHGIAALVEGKVKPADKVLLVEDLITDAQSKLHFVDSITSCGGVASDVLVLFDRLQGGRESLKLRGLELHALTDITSALSVAAKSDFVTVHEIGSVEQYLASPRDWHLQRGLSYEG